MKTELKDRIFKKVCKKLEKLKETDLSSTEEETDLSTTRDVSGISSTEDETEIFYTMFKRIYIRRR